MSDDVKRVPVDFNYEAVNPTFLKMLARIGSYAAEKYGSWEQYTRARLVGEKSPINHAYEHIRCYVVGEPYDKFDGDPKWHLAAAAYNLMMEFFYASKFGCVDHPLVIRDGSTSSIVCTCETARGIGRRPVARVIDSSCPVHRRSP